MRKKRKGNEKKAKYRNCDQILKCLGSRELSVCQTVYIYSTVVISEKSCFEHKNA